ncbi:hypothetical protein JCM9279_005285 [Rhodotorula babjevae]
MLPWNPPSAFSLTGDQQQQQRYGYSDASGSQMQNNHQQQSPTGNQQQQMSPQQQQQQLAPGAIPPPPTNQSAYPPMTLAATLHFLQSEHRRYARDRNEWEIERAEMRARIALLEGEKRGNEAALKSLGRRCKMLEMALRGERSKFLSTTNALGGTPSVSGTASPVPGGTPALGKDPLATVGGIPPHKLAALQKDAPASSASAPVSPGGEQLKSAPMAASSSTPGPSASVPAPSTSTSTSSVPAHARGDSLSVPAPAPNGQHNTGTWSSAASAAAATAGARDPRGKARSREYLKQCLQEITYLTSSATLNPLAAHSYAAPSVPRPRKVLPEQVPPASAPGVINLAQPPATAAAAGSAQTGEVPPLAAGGESSSASSAPTPSKSAPAVVTPAPAAESTSSTGNKAAPHHDLLTSFPSDPPSAFVPLRRQISQPGQQGPGALSRSSNPHQLQGQSRKQRDDAALDAEIARLAAPEANEDKPDDVSAALAAEKGALISQRELPVAAPVVVAEPEPLVKEDEVVNAAPGAASEKAAAPSASSSSDVEPSTDIGLDAEHDVELEHTREPVKFSPEELALQAAHAAPEANEEKPDDAVALIATAGEDGEDESEVEGKDVAPQDDKDEVRLPYRPCFEHLCASTDCSRTVQPSSSVFDASRASIGRAGGTLSRGRGQRKSLAAVLASSGLSGGPDSAAAAAAAAPEEAGDDEDDAPTAIFAAGGGAARGDEWRRKLQEAGRRAYPGFAGRAGAGAGGDKELQDLEWDLEAATVDEDEDEGGTKAKKAKNKREGKEEDTVGLSEGERFKPRRVLRSHLYAVRVVASVEVDGDELVVTSGDDCVVKAWRNALGKPSSRSDLEPVVTLRGHLGPVLAVAASRPSSTDDEPVLFSASLDSTIRIWAFPSASHDTYDPVDPSLAQGVLEPGADAVWGLAPLSHDRLACITADGSIQVWNWRARERLASWTYGAAEPAKGSLRKRPAQVPTPTALAVVEAELEDSQGVKELLIVAFQNAVIKVFDVEDGREVKRIEANESADDTPETQINALAVHSSLSLVATAHEDRFIRVFDLHTGECLVSYLAHLDGVTSLAFSPAPPTASSSGQGVALASASHDTSLRIWRLQVDRTGGGKSSLTCVQEASTHRVKGAEGVLAVSFASSGKYIVTAGADGTARVWEQ